MKAYKKSRYSSTILDPSTRWRSAINFMPLPLYLQQKESLVTIGQGAGQASELVWMMWRRE
jgi:hypothetical protein